MTSRQRTVRLAVLHGRAIAAVLVLVGVLGGASLSASAAGEPPAVAVPADLQVLIERSQHLQVPYLITTERVSFSGGGMTAVLVSLAQQSRTSPPESALTTGGLFGAPWHAKYLRGTAYLEPPRETVSAIPGLVRRMHGRRWISVTRRELTRKPTVSASAPIHPSAPNPLASTGLAALVAIETNIVETGPATVAGQPVTEFTGTVDPSLLSKDIHDNFTGLESVRSVTVILDIAPNGLLKRIKLIGASDGVEFDAIGEVLSINTPVDVHPPSPIDTIRAASLTRSQLDHLNL